MSNDKQEERPVLTVVMGTPAMDVNSWPGGSDLQPGRTLGDMVRNRISFTLRQSEGMDPSMAQAIQYVREAGYRLHCHFIGTSSALVNASRAGRGIDPVDAAKAWHRLRVELAATAASYDHVALIRSDSGNYVTTHVFVDGEVAMTAADDKRTASDDQLAQEVLTSLQSGQRTRDRDAEASPTASQATQAGERETSADGLYGHLLFNDPVPAEALWPLLRYLDDVFVAVATWLSMENSPEPGDITERGYLLAVGTEGGRRTARIAHPRSPIDQSSSTETYNKDQIPELLKDMVSYVTGRLEVRSAWNRPSTEPAAPEEMRVALAGAGLEGYWMHCPLDSEGKAMWSLTSLRLGTQEPEGDESKEVALNTFADNLLDQLMRAASEQPRQQNGA